MSVEMINGSEIESKIKEGVHVVNIFGTWCGPCKMFAPILEEVSETTPVHKIDVDLNKEFATEMKIQGVPTTLFYKDGVLKDTVVGFVPKNVVEEKINSL